MPGRDVALAVRRLIDSPWACRSLAAGDDYALSGLNLTVDERALLTSDVTESIDDMATKLALACIDPTLRDEENAGVFFKAAQSALFSLEGSEAKEFQSFLRALHDGGHQST